MRNWIRTSVCLLASIGSMTRAEAAFPERKILQGDGYAIEYSAGDDAYAQALAAQLPLKPAATPPPAEKLRLALDDLVARRADVLRLIGEQLALPPTTPQMQQVYDGFLKSNVAIVAMPALPAPSRFALWRSEEIQARMAAGEEITGFRRAADGGLEFSMDTSFQLNEGEAPDVGIQRMLSNWSRAVWPLKIGAEPGVAPDAELRARLATMQDNLAGLASFQGAEVRRMAVVNVLHETVESTLVSQYLHSADRRWFCEGVANYVAFAVMESLIGTQAAKAYYDVDGAVARYAELRDRVALEDWPVAEDPMSRELPADVNVASYAFASKLVFDAFGEARQGTLPKVLRQLAKAGIEKTSINDVRAAYEKVTGRKLDGLGR